MSVKTMPHYTLSTADLADWIDSQPETWLVDNEHELMCVVDFPCPSDELSPEIRRFGKDLIIYDKTPGSQARGDRIGKDRIADFTFVRNVKGQKEYLLSWPDADEGWLLRETDGITG